MSGKKTGVRVWPAVLLAGMLTAATARPGPAQGRPERPNVIFILADDLGWSDTTLYGTTALYQTPNLERLARRGMRFRRAYTANPLCSPTRASILTGLYPGRIGITAPACHLPEERFDAVLTPRPQPFHRARGQVSATRLKHEYVTLAERFQSAGYRTAHFGKWHLGREPYHPQSQGFEVDWPGEPSLPGPAGGYLAPWRFVRRAELQGKPGEHIEDRMAAEAARFIQQHREQPFYLNYWAYSVHSPWSAKPELVERYRSRVRPDAPQRNPLYAAMVQSLDDAVRTLLDAVDRAGIAERTILVFFSDNGGWIWNPRATSPPGYETIPATSNAPLRGGKATLYEGGTRVPCVVVWPGVTRPNSRMDALFSSVDWHPTLLTMAGLPPAPGRQLDGVNQERVLRGKAPARDTLFCFFPHYTPATENIPGTWIRQERWKLIRFHHDSESQEDRFELYDLREDPGETRNLAGVEPARVQELNRRIETHLTEIGALVPDRNPGFRKDARPGEPAAAGPAIRGWTAVRDCTLAHRNGALIVTSTGGDPHLSTRFDPVPAGEYSLEIRIIGRAAGPGQWFWQEEGVSPPFFRDRSVPFAMTHDGILRDLTLRFTAAKPIRAFRLDPAAGPGQVWIPRIRVRKPDGTVIREWDFGAKEEGAP